MIGPGIEAAPGPARTAARQTRILWQQAALVLLQSNPLRPARLLVPKRRTVSLGR
jgi:hypothetical protein